MTELRRERAVRSDSLRNRDAILDAAAECLTANPSSTLSDIAHAASVARITLYGHFASRNELLTALLERSMVRVEAELGSVDLSGVSMTLTPLWVVTEVPHRRPGDMASKVTSCPNAAR